MMTIVLRADVVSVTCLLDKFVWLPVDGCYLLMAVTCGWRLSVDGW
jgi:hypothetical protein